MRFLIIQTSFIGDVVLSTGIAEKLHEFFPNAGIDYLVRKGNESLFKDHPFIHRVIVWDKKNRKYRNILRLLKEIRQSRYDKVINLQRFAASGFLTAFSGAKETIGYQKNPFSFLFTHSFPHIIGEGIEQHETERNHSLIADFTDRIVAKPRLYPSASDNEKVSKYISDPFLTIAPASVWFTKQFPKEKWIEFLNMVRDKKVYLLGGKGDIRLCEGIVNSSLYKNIEILAGSLSFLETASLMKFAAMNYTNDSAPMHFASAVNAPVAAVYCSTIPAFGFGPLSDRSYIFEEKENLACRPCGLHGRTACPLGHFKCAYSIPVTELVALH